VILESLVLAIAAGTLGALLALWGGRILIAALSANAGRVAVGLSADGYYFAATAVISLFAGLLFGLLPALRISSGPAARYARSTGLGSSTGGKGGRLLVLAQVAISLPLLVGAILFLQTIHNLNRVPLGFDPEGLVHFECDPALNGYDLNGTQRFFDEVLTGLNSIPGVRSATLLENALISGWISNTVISVDGSEPTSILMNRVGPRFFETTGMRLLAGRDLGEQDHGEAPLVAVINEAAAHEFFSSGTPVGRYFTRTFRGEAHQVEVVGIVANSRYRGLRDDIRPIMFIPHRQSGLSEMFVMVRAEPVDRLSEQIVAAVAAVDPDVPVTNLRTQSEQIRATLGSERVYTGFLVFFGCLALFLASIGLYGITVTAVEHRTAEMGLRVALGARRSAVIWLILRDVVVLTGLGLVAGVALSLAGTSAIRASLFGVAPWDPLSTVLAALLLLTLAVLSGLIPARRAARLDPIVALRSE
jgi:predicted permease